ncbi:MAG: peptidoglycan-binding protein [Pseudomonadota bacterium]
MARHEPFLDDDGDYAEPNVYRRKPGRHPADDHAMDEEDWDGRSWGLMDRVLAAPGHLAMTVVAVAAFGIVAVNAAYRQPGAHPAPILSTRAEAPAQPVPTTGRDTSIADLQDRIAATPAPSLPPRRSAGAETTASIGVDVRTPYIAPAPVPRPQALAVRPSLPVPTATTANLPPRVVQPRPVPVSTIAVDDPIGALLAPVVGNPAVQATPQPLPGQPFPGQPVATRSAQPMVQAVQTILSQLGYQPGSIDGVIGPSTEEAIRRFQLRRALEPNGQITNELLREIERVTGERITSS